jgi:pilus assembly protein Flp/PilA
MKTLTKFYLMLRNRKGATMTEYAVIAAVVIVVAILAFSGLGTTIVAKIGELVAGM